MNVQPFLKYFPQEMIPIKTENTRMKGNLDLKYDNHIFDFRTYSEFTVSSVKVSQALIHKKAEIPVSAVGKYYVDDRKLRVDFFDMQYRNPGEEPILRLMSRDRFYFNINCFTPFDWSVVANNAVLNLDVQCNDLSDFVGLLPIPMKSGSLNAKMQLKADSGEKQITGKGFLSVNDFVVTQFNGQDSMPGNMKIVFSCNSSGLEKVKSFQISSLDFLLKQNSDIIADGRFTGQHDFLSQTTLLDGKLKIHNLYPILKGFPNIVPLNFGEKEQTSFTVSFDTSMNWAKFEHEYHWTNTINSLGFCDPVLTGCSMDISSNGTVQMRQNEMILTQHTSVHAANLADLLCDMEHNFNKDSGW